MDYLWHSTEKLINQYLTQCFCGLIGHWVTINHFFKLVHNHKDIDITPGTFYKWTEHVTVHSLHDISPEQHLTEWLLSSVDNRYCNLSVSVLNLLPHASHANGTNSCSLVLSRPWWSDGLASWQHVHTSFLQAWGTISYFHRGLTVSSHR